MGEFCEVNRVNSELIKLLSLVEPAFWFSTARINVQSDPLSWSCLSVYVSTGGKGVPARVVYKRLMFFVVSVLC